MKMKKSLDFHSARKDAGKNQPREDTKAKEADKDEGDFQTSAPQDSSIGDGVEFLTVGSSESHPLVNKQTQCCDHVP
jgi:hypothetical protein